MEADAAPWEKVAEEGDTFVNNKGEPSKPTEEESSHTQMTLHGRYLFPNRYSVESLMCSWPSKGCIRFEGSETRHVEPVSRVSLPPTPLLLTK